MSVLNLNLYCFLMDAFSSIKERNTSLKEINRLLSKEISNIYLKVTIEKE